MAANLVLVHADAGVLLGPRDEGEAVEYVRMLLGYYDGKLSLEQASDKVRDFLW